MEREPDYIDLHRQKEEQRKTIESKTRRALALTFVVLALAALALTCFCWARVGVGQWQLPEWDKTYFAFATLALAFAALIARPRENR